MLITLKIITVIRVSKKVCFDRHQSIPSSNNSSVTFKVNSFKQTFQYKHLMFAFQKHSENNEKFWTIIVLI